MTDVTEIDRVGPNYATELTDAGFETAEDVANADPADIDAIVETASGETIVQNAVDVVTESQTESEPTDTRTLDHELSDSVRRHAIAALVAMEIEARRTNNNDQIDLLHDAIAELESDERPYEFTTDQLNELYRGLNEIESQYRSTRGLSDFVGQIVQLRENVQEKRLELLDR
jgi:hypothetical protein